MGENGRQRPDGGVDHGDTALAAALAVEETHYVPGTIDAESFDEHGLADAQSERRYDDTLTLARHGEEGVHVAWLKSGEWLAYETDVDGAGAYELTARVAAAPEYGGGSFRLECDGVDVGQVAFDATDGWYDWQEVTIRLGLAAGDRTLTIVAEEGGWSLDWLAIERPT